MDWQPKVLVNPPSIGLGMKLKISQKESGSFWKQRSWGTALCQSTPTSIQIDHLLTHSLGERQTVALTTERPPEQKPHVKDVDIDEPENYWTHSRQKSVNVDIRMMNLQLLGVKHA